MVAHDVVRSHGGRVMRVTLIPGSSTTRIVERLGSDAVTAAAALAGA